MKKTKEIIISIVLVIICIIVASIFNKKDYKIKYTFFYRNNNSIYMLDSYGRKVLDDEFNYASKNNDGYYLVVNNDKKVAIIDEQGNFIINYNEYDNIEEYGKLYIAYKGEESYLITKNNKVVRKVENEKELVSRILKNYSVLLFDNKYHIYDNDGNTIKELDYNKKKKISLKETENYGQVFYDNKEYVFSLNTFEINEIDTKVVSDMKEGNKILLLNDEKTRIFVNGKLEKEAELCKSSTIDEFGIVKCNEEILYEPTNTNEKDDDIKVICDKKCTLLKDNKKILKDYDEISINETNLKKYIVTIKGKKITILNDEFKPIFKTKKSVKFDTNYMIIDKKNYTFEGFVINL